MYPVLFHPRLQKSLNSSDISLKTLLNRVTSQNFRKFRKQLYHHFILQLSPAWLIQFATWLKGKGGQGGGGGEVGLHVRGNL